MNEFIKKLIERLEEVAIETLGINKSQFAMDKGEYSSYCSLSLCEVKEKANQLAEEYKEQTIDAGELVRKSEWIPCSERLPEGNLIDCLVTLKNGVVTKAVYSEMHTEKFYMVSTLGTDYFYKENPVIAWQPLPAPYQPKGE